jgi:hypothetical protein
MPIAFEVVTAASLVVVVLMQRPGLKNESYSRKHNIWQTQRRKLSMARQAELEYWQRHSLVRLVMDHGRGLIAYAVGFGIVLLSTPGSIHPDWTNHLIFAVGLVIQLLATVSYDVCGVLTFRRISRALQEAESE